MSTEMHVEIRKISFAVKNSSTLALPEWNEILRRKNLAPRMIPRDVKTRWNSTYDMLDIALQYRAAIDDLTANRKFSLRDYEMNPEDWKIAAQLCKVLQVSIKCSISYCTFLKCAGLQDRNNGFFAIGI